MLDAAPRCQTTNKPNHEHDVPNCQATFRGTPAVGEADCHLHRPMFDDDCTDLPNDLTIYRGVSSVFQVNLRLDMTRDGYLHLPLQSRHRLGLMTRFRRVTALKQVFKLDLSSLRETLTFLCLVCLPRESWEQQETICAQSICASASRIRQTENWKGISCLLLSWDGVFHFGKVFLRFAIVMKPGDSGVG